MNRRIAGCVAAFSAVCGVAAATSSGKAHPIDFGLPPPAKVSTARLGLADGVGAKRLALWTATNARGELCVGWQTGASAAAPTNFTCLRRGLEQPLIMVESGGGRGGVATWGTIVGLASPLISHLTAETLYGSASVQTLRLRSISSLPGWRVFTTSMLEHPTSTKLNAYGKQGQLLAQGSGASIHPEQGSCSPCMITPPPGVATSSTGSTWSDSADNIPDFAGGKSAVSIALGDRTVQSILTAHQGWLDSVAQWSNCSNQTLGKEVSFRFPQPATFTATVPVKAKPDGSFSYSTGIERMLAASWLELNAWVDTNTSQIVGIDGNGYVLPDEQPGPQSSATSVLATVVSPHDAGGVDPGSPACWESES